MKKGKQYRLHLESPEWKEKRKAAIEKAGERCQLCNVTGPMHVHHRTYERLGNELLDDLTVLCPPCHRRHHRSGETPRGRGERRREIDQEILLVVRTAGLIAWRDVQRQIKAPRAQAWARAQKLVKTHRLRWKHGKLEAV